MVFLHYPCKEYVLHLSFKQFVSTARLSDIFQIICYLVPMAQKSNLAMTFISFDQGLKLCSLVRKYCKIWRMYNQCVVCEFWIILYHVRKHVATFRSVVTLFRAFLYTKYKSMQNSQTSHDIFHIIRYVLFFLDSYSSDEDDSDVSDQQKILHTTEKKPTNTLAFTLNTSKLRIAMFPKTKV